MVVNVATGAGPPSIWLEVVKLALPSLTVIAGWYIVSLQQNRRERRKEIREIISDIKAHVDFIVSNSVKYFKEKDDQEADAIAGNMKYDSIMISKALLLLSTAGLNVDCSEEMTDFRNSAMGEFFETSDRKKQLSDPSWIQDLGLNAGTLLDKIETSYFTYFRLSMNDLASWWRKKSLGGRLADAREFFGARGYRAS